MILNIDDCNGIQRFILNHYFESDITTIDQIITILCKDDDDLLILKKSISNIISLSNCIINLDVNNPETFIFISEYIKYNHLVKNNLDINDYSVNTLKKYFEPYNKIIKYYYSTLYKMIEKIDKKIKKVK
jgi:hypothetical protein